MVFVVQELGTNVGERDVVLQVVRDFPDVPGGGGVKDQRVAEITADPARGGLDPAARGGHLRIVCFGGHRWTTDPWRPDRRERDRSPCGWRRPAPGRSPRSIPGPPAPTGRAVG